MGVAAKVTAILHFREGLFKWSPYWLSSNENEIIIRTLDLSGVKSGTYELAIRVPNPLRNGHPLKFANKTQDADAPTG